MKSLVRVLPYLALAFASAIVVPVIAAMIAPGMNCDLFLPLALYAGLREPLVIVVAVSWISGSLGEITGFLIPGIAVLSIQTLALLVHATSRWLAVRSPAGFLMVCIPASAMSEFIRYMACAVIQQKPAFSINAVASCMAATSAWGLASYLMLDRFWTAVGRKLPKTGQEEGNA